MKYIRTKDNIIYQVYDKVFEYKGDKRYQLVDSRFEISLNDIIKQAYTIEELCDWFVVEGDDNEITYHKTLFSAETDGKDYILESNETYTIYGCVLVKGQGLIYVARMNDKGELELL